MKKKINTKSYEEWVREFECPKDNIAGFTFKGKEISEPEPLNSIGLIAWIDRVKLPGFFKSFYIGIVLAYRNKDLNYLRIMISRMPKPNIPLSEFIDEELHKVRNEERINK